MTIEEEIRQRMALALGRKIDWDLVGYPDIMSKIRLVNRPGNWFTRTFWRWIRIEADIEPRYEDDHHEGPRPVWLPERKGE